MFVVNVLFIFIIDKYYEGNLNEDVFISDIDNKHKTAKLTYNRVPASTGGRYRNMGNKKSGETVKTDKMDTLNGSDTYEVPLKGGLTSYNITSINGTAVMHYFKHKKEAQIKMGNVDYDLEMEDPEFNSFKQTFLAKVNAVVQYRSQQFVKDNKEVVFDKVCIYPVPSSSGFNKEMAKCIAGKSNIANLPTQIVRSEILKKDTSNLERDEDFIKNNLNYYNSRRYYAYPGDENRKEKETHMNALVTDMNKLRARAPIKQAAENVNIVAQSLLQAYYAVNQALKQNRQDKAQGLLAHLDELYTKYQYTLNDLYSEKGSYVDDYDGSTHTQLNLRAPLKYTKDASVQKRTEAIYNILKSNGLGKNLISGGIKNTLKKYPVCQWAANDFQIKNFANDTRMALKNYFQPDKDQDMVRQEVEKTHGSVVVVFDDNVSGGATLSDICLQLQNLGIEYIIPITFGEMRQSYNQGNKIKIFAPEDNFNTNYQPTRTANFQGSPQMTS